MIKKILSAAAAVSVFFNMTFALTDNFQPYIPVFAEEDGEISASSAPEASLPADAPGDTPASTDAPEDTPLPSPTRTPRPVRTPRPTDDPDTMPTPPQVPNTDLSAGDIIISEKGTYEIENVKSAYHIIVKDNVKNAEIVLYNTEIISDGPVQIGKNCSVVIAYDGTNTIESTSENAAVLVPKGSSLTLEGSGTLSVSGKGAAIGSDTTDAGVINITSGTLTARSSGRGAAIGGGKNKSASEINITGGDTGAYAVTGAAIGGGDGADSGNITISGGNIKAESDRGAAIGGGNGGNGENITISGGNIKAESGKGAAIGGGDSGSSKKTAISGGNIEVRCGAGCAAIGGGYKKSGGTITVTGGTILGYAGEYGRIIGGGRYCTSSKVEISGNADITGYVKEGACAVEKDEISGRIPMICAFYTIDNRSVYNKTELPSAEQTIKLSCGNTLDTVTLPKDYQGFFRTLKTTGTYNLKTDAGDPIKHYPDKASPAPSYSSNLLTEDFNISSGINHFALTPSDSCYLEEPEFITNDIVLAENDSRKLINLSAQALKVSPVSCTSTAHRNQGIVYTYEIVSDESKIASLKDRTLTVDARDSGVYPIGIKVTAVCGNLSSEKTLVLNVIKQSYPHDISSKDLNITSSGVYTIYGSTTRYNINVAPDLSDVNIIFSSNTTIDMSRNTTSRTSPVIIGDGSKVTLTVPSSVTLKSTDTGSCIDGGRDTEITITGNYSSSSSSYSSSSSSSIRLDCTDTGNCITGGKVYLLSGSYNMSAAAGYAVKADDLFIADDVSGLAAWTENGKDYPLKANYITSSYKSYKPAYIVQGRLSGSIGEEGASITVRRTTSDDDDDYSSRYSSSKYTSAIVRTSSKDCKAFAVKVYTYGNYKVLSDHSKTYAAKVGNRDIDEITLEKEKTYIASNIYSNSECKCKISAPSFKMENVILPYEKSSASYVLDAEGGAFTLDKNCRIHSSSSVSYSYAIEEDKAHIASIDDDRIRFSVRTPGKYTVKITAMASANGMSAEKTASMTVTKLSEEEMTKQRGELHSTFIQGYDDDTFRPDNNITRAEAATILTSALEIDDYNKSETAFFDVSRKEWYYDTVLAAEEAGIFSGYEDGSFRPDNNITRAEFTVAVCNAFNISVNSKTTKSKSKLEDINEHWSKSYVDALVKTKYINGYGDGTFRPDNFITRAEAVAILNRAKSRTPNTDKLKDIRINNPFEDVSKTHWAFYDVMEAVTDHYSKEWHK